MINMFKLLFFVKVFALCQQHYNNIIIFFVRINALSFVNINNNCFQEVPMYLGIYFKFSHGIVYNIVINIQTFLSFCYKVTKISLF